MSVYISIALSRQFTASVKCDKIVHYNKLFNTSLYFVFLFQSQTDFVFSHSNDLYHALCILCKDYDDYPGMLLLCTIQLFGLLFD